MRLPIIDYEARLVYETNTGLVVSYNVLNMGIQVKEHLYEHFIKRGLINAKEDVDNDTFIVIGADKFTCRIRYYDYSANPSAFTNLALDFRNIDREVRENDVLYSKRIMHTFDTPKNIGLHLIYWDRVIKKYYLDVRNIDDNDYVILDNTQTTTETHELMVSDYFNKVLTNDTVVVNQDRIKVFKVENVKKLGMELLIRVIKDNYLLVQSN